MATIERFEELRVWQSARQLYKEVYQCTSLKPFSRDYAPKDQIIRAANSILLNIAEGFGRQSNKEFKHFVYISHGSAAEVQACLYIARDQEYLDVETFDRLYRQTERYFQDACWLHKVSQHKDLSGIAAVTETLSKHDNS